MKNLKDIERMSFEELEKVSLDEGVKAPEGLGERLEGGMAGLAAAGEGGKSGTRLRTAIYSFAGAAAALMLALILTGGPGTPRDSFDDPMLAYAEVQKSLSLISEKLNKGMDVVQDAAPAMDRPKEIIDKLKR